MSLAAEVPDVAVIDCSDPVTLLLWNQSGAPVGILGGETAVTITFGDLVAQGEGGAVQLQAIEGWESAAPAAPDGTLTIRATAGGSLDAGASLRFMLTGVTPQQPTRVSVLTIAHTCVQGAPDDVLVAAVVVQAGPLSTPLPVEASVSPRSVPVQPDDGPSPPIASSIALRIRYPASASGPLVDPTARGLRQFYLTAVYADPPGRAALTSVSLADLSLLSARIGTFRGDEWKLNKIQDHPPRWGTTEVPPQVLDPGDFVDLIVDNIVTDLALGTTVVYLQYELPRPYGMGFIPYLVTKVDPEPGVISLRVDSPNPIHGDGPVQLSWSSYVIPTDEWLELTFTENGVPRTLNSNDGDLPLQGGQFTASSDLRESTEFRLAAFNGGQLINARKQTVTVIPA